MFRLHECLLDKNRMLRDFPGGPVVKNLPSNAGDASLIPGFARYEGMDRAEAEDLAVGLSVEMAQKIAPYTDGLYFMTPFKRVALMERILKALE